MGWFEKLSQGKKNILLVGGVVTFTLFLIGVVKPYNEHQRYQTNQRAVELLLKSRKEGHSSEGMDSISDVK